MRDIEKELFINNFDINDYDKELVDSIDDFEAKIKGEIPINKEDLRKIIKKTGEVRFVDTSEIENMHILFHHSRYKELDLSRWSTSKVTDMEGMFKGCKSLIELDLSHFNTSNVERMDSMFNDCNSLMELDLSSFKTLEVKDMRYMFYSCESLKELDLSRFNTLSVERMDNMFNKCKSLKKLDISGFNTSNVEYMESMFSSCESLEKLDLSSFNTRKVDYMNCMFSDCSSLEELDLLHFNTQYVNDMNKMFYNCQKLRKLDLSSFKTSEVKNMSSMFENCNSLVELDLSGFDTFRVNHMNCMFNGCKSLKELDISSFALALGDVSVCGMFKGCDDLVLDFNKFEIAFELIQKMNLPCFKYTLGEGEPETSEIFEITHSLDSDLLDLAFLDNSEGMSFVKHLKEKGVIDIYKAIENLYFVERKDKVYLINKEQLEKLEEAGVLIEVENPKMENRRKNKM